MAQNFAECLTCNKRWPANTEPPICGMENCPTGKLKSERIRVTSGHDPVNHPDHYTKHPSGIECIEITRHMSFNLGNAVKYIWRADLKNGLEDLEKAIWYLQDEIKKRKK